MAFTTFAPGTTISSAFLNGIQNSNNIRFQSLKPNSVQRTVQQNLDTFTSVFDFGALGDGIADDTVALQNALNNAGELYIPDGTYICSPLLVQSNTTLYFSPKAVFKAKTGYGVNDKLLRIENVSNVTIFGNYATIQMLKAEYTTGENRHAVNIVGSSQVSIYNLIAKDSGGDGFYVGGSAYCENINLIGCIADNNRRQGLSITNVIGCNVIGGHYKNTIGTAPECGIDIESNLADGYYLQNVNIIGARTSGNNGGGILVTPQSKYAPVSITVSDCTSYYDGIFAGGIGIKAAMAYTPTTPAGLIGKIQGKITIKDCVILSPQGAGIYSANWTENAPSTLLKNITVIDPYSNSAVAATTRNQCGMLIRGETPSSGTYGTSVGNITVEGLKCVDDRAVPLMSIPVYLEPADEATKPLKSITLRGIEAVKAEWTSANLTPVLRAGSLATTDIVIEYAKEWIVSSASTTVGVSVMGAVMSTVTSSNFTLPNAADVIGSSFTFRHVNAGNLQVTPQAADNIDNYSPSAGVGLIARTVGAQITLKAVAANRWQVVNETGGWGVSTFYGERYRTSYNTAAPTTGTWTRGDIVWNESPSAAGTVGWVCTTGGSPGTWKTFGNIAA